MLNENRNKSYICHTKLQPTLINTVAVENMRDIKESESCDDTDATVRCDNKIKDLQTKLEVMTNTIIRDQKRKSLKKVLNDALYDKVKSRTQGICSARWVIADAGATGHFVMAGAPVINVKPTTSPIGITLPDGQIIMKRPWTGIRSTTKKKEQR